MPQPSPPIAAAPSLTFYVTARQPLRPVPILLATVLAAAALFAVLVALHQNHPAHLASSDGVARSPDTTSASTPDDKDDPNQVDTIVLGDPADAPAPARRGDHISPVHPTLIVRLPRFGDETGLIPDTPAGRALYAWLAAFNHASFPALQNALPNLAPRSIAAAEIDLRQQTGGFTLLSAREPQPGLLVFRLRAQPPSTLEALGTLQLTPNTSPATVASFSLRTLDAPPAQPRNRPENSTP